MGLYEFFSSKTPSNLFKIKFGEAYNFLSNYSFGELKISDSTAKLKIRANFEELKDIARGINDPLNEYFNFYLTVQATRLSVGAALIAMENLMNIAFKDNRIGRTVVYNTLSNAVDEASNYHACRLKVNRIINN